MCGIAGEISFRQGNPGNADWENISLLMSRRGPDDAGKWMDGGICTLVFRRLAILDLSSKGSQPMIDRKGRYALVFNGELYNFLELKAELQGRGVQFRSSSDTEVVLYALMEWGARALERFNGMFALAFYDSQTKLLLLARDHAGIKPLYYLKNFNGVVFASQYNQLMAHPWGNQLMISSEALGLYLRLAYIPAPYGLLKNTFMLEPGTWLQVTHNGEIQQRRYFEFPRCGTPSLKGMEAVEAVDSAVSQAVARQLISDVPVGAFLSGGIDSPLVVSKMRACLKGDIQAYTIGTGEKHTDETEDAILYAKELGLSHTIERVDPEGVLSLLDDVIEACHEPFGDYSMFPTMLVSQIASQKFKVMLSGDGGDELFWGYPDRFGSLLRRSFGPGVPFWRRMRENVDRLMHGTQVDWLSTGQNLGDSHRRSLSHLSESWLQRIFPSIPKWTEDYKIFDYPSRRANLVAQWSRGSEFVCHLPYVLMKVDRASMYHSLEVRVPLLDLEVIKVATQVDWRDCLDLERKVGKILLRKSLAKTMAHQSHGKKGFEVPMGMWLRTSLRELFQDIVLGQKEILGLEINQKELRLLFQEHLEGRHNYAWGLWPLLSLSLWRDRHYHA